MPQQGRGPQINKVGQKIKWVRFKEWHDEFALSRHSNMDLDSYDLKIPVFVSSY